MSHSDDPFDNEYENSPDDEDGDNGSVEALVWQLLVLINPGDDETTLQQFLAYREAVANADEGEIEPVEVIGQVVDWRSGFYVDWKDTPSLVQVLDELSARWNLSIDWNGDPDDDEFFDGHDAVSLLAIAYDCLAAFGYTLWLWETGGDSYAGWMTLKRDGEALRELAIDLGIHLRLGSEAE
ncbi:DUF6630 family protein [Dyella tabacisoli]|uniref:DUF6630 domain-containing protein n=1 Tax=Dyella tabacisoli TaxID=2282381 RepID=A0A369UWP4_9GAMM|nr:hypothetical protein [Dyella tabacisoli]RDD82749.1 hypothetical protein DVJ77_04305 [Dyella tabacisoli]